jgi:hypothetical protein
MSVTVYETYVGVSIGIVGLLMFALLCTLGVRGDIDRTLVRLGVCHVDVCGR